VRWYCTLFHSEHFFHVQPSIYTHILWRTIENILEDKLTSFSLLHIFSIFGCFLKKKKHPRRGLIWRIIPVFVVDCFWRGWSFDCLQCDFFFLLYGSSCLAKSLDQSLGLNGGSRLGRLCGVVFFFCSGKGGEGTGFMFRYLSFFSGASFFLFLFLFLFLFFSSLFLFFLSFLFLFSSLIFFSLSFLYFFFSLFFSFSFFLSLFFCFCLFCFCFCFLFAFLFRGWQETKKPSGETRNKKKEKRNMGKKKELGEKEIILKKKKKKKKETLFFFLSFSFISFPSPSVLPFLLSYECSDANKPGEATEDPG
jgi:hypothetical protein